MYYLIIFPKGGIGDLGGNVSRVVERRFQPSDPCRNIELENRPWTGIPLWEPRGPVGGLQHPIQAKYPRTDTLNRKKRFTLPASLPPPRRKILKAAKRIES